MNTRLDNRLVVEMLAWLAVSLLVMLVEGVALSAGAPWAFDYSASLRAIGCVSMLFGARVFIGHGGARVTTLGLFGLACSLLVGYAAWASAGALSNLTPPHYLYLAASYGLLVQIAVGAIGLLRGTDDRSQERVVWSPRIADSLSGVGLVGLVILLLIRVAEPGLLGVFLEGSAFACCLALSMGLVLRRGRRLFVSRMVLLAFAIGVYALVFHSGGGRLRVVALLFGVLLIASLRLPDVRVKLAALGTVPIGLAALATDRLLLQESLSIGSSYGRTGLESMTIPLSVFGQILEAQAAGRLDLAWGRTLVSAPLQLLPQWLVPNRAIALGYELVTVFYPSRSGTGYSITALFLGEWTYNFSPLGLLLLVPILVWSLMRLDTWLSNSIGSETPGRWNMLQGFVILLLCAAVSDFAWSGVHTYIMRTLTRLPAAVLCVVIAGLLVRSSRAKQMGG